MCINFIRNVEQNKFKFSDKKSPLNVFVCFGVVGFFLTIICIYLNKTCHFCSSSCFS